MLVTQRKVTHSVQVNYYLHIHWMTACHLCKSAHDTKGRSRSGCHLYFFSWVGHSFCPQRSSVRVDHDCPLMVKTLIFLWVSSYHILQPCHFFLPLSHFYHKPLSFWLSDLSMYWPIQTWDHLLMSEPRRVHLWARDNCEAELSETHLKD